MPDKYYSVIDAEGFYKDLVLTQDIPAPEKLVLDLGEIGAAEMTPASWEQVSGVMPESETGQLDACKAVSNYPYIGRTEDKRVFCYAPSADGKRAALLIVDLEHEAIFRFVGPLEREGETCTIKNEDIGDSISFTFEQRGGGVVEKLIGYQLAEGDSLVPRTGACGHPHLRIHTGTPGFIRPKWDGKGWVDGATEEEIAAWELEHPAPVPVPNPVDVLGAQVAKLTLENMQLNQLVNVMGPELAQAKLELMSLKGGV